MPNPIRKSHGCIACFVIVLFRGNSSRVKNTLMTRIMRCRKYLYDLLVFLSKTLTISFRIALFYWYIFPDQGNCSNYRNNWLLNIVVHFRSKRPESVVIIERFWKSLNNTSVQKWCILKRCISVLSHILQVKIIKLVYVTKHQTPIAVSSKPNHSDAPILDKGFCPRN